MSVDTDDIRDILDRCATWAGVAGAQVTVVTPTDRVDVAWGRATADRRLDVTDRMQVGSIAKVLTAVLVHQLVDDGLVSLTDSAEIAGAPDVEIGHLISMTSGLDWGIWAPGETVDEAVRPQLTLPRTAPSGCFGYSFASTMIAARLIELRRNTIWWQAVADRIATPLGMGFTDVPDSPGHARATADSGVDEWTEYQAPPLTGMGPTGTTFCSSAGDLAALATALATGHRLLSPESTAALHRPVVDVGASMCADVWCYGPYARRAGERMLHGHGGRWAGGVSDLTWEAATGTAVAIVTNTPARGGALVRALSEALHPLVWGAEAFVPTETLSDDDPACSTGELDRLVGDYATATREYSVRRTGHRLAVEARALPHPDAAFALPDGSDELAAVGSRRFLPVVEGMDDRRLQEYWFSSEPEPAVFFDGFVAARRRG